jgi:thiamine biosynthesis lipoprotein
VTTNQAESLSIRGVVFEAMATPVTIRVMEPRSSAARAISSAENVVRDVDRSCTRFSDRSELSRVNAHPSRWHAVSPIFAAALTAAELAYIDTSGRVDPRVLDDLEALGYVVTFAEVDKDGPALVRARVDRRMPRAFHVEHASGRIRLDGHRIDLGGIAKGLAVDLALALVAGAGSGALVEAGGDLAVSGEGPDGGAWNIDVEDPLARGFERDAIAVLSVRDAAVATSSIRQRRWRRGDRSVHHLIDPTTGSPAENGLAAVTVVAETAVAAERWSKALFIGGVEAIRGEADARSIPALWIDDRGALGHSAAMDTHLIWRSPDVAAI